MRSKTRITVHVKLAGPIDGRSLSISGSVGVRQGDSLQKLLKAADVQLGKKGERPFTRAFRQGVPPVVLVNGDRVDFPDGKHRPLAEGDQVSVILALAGG